MITLEQSYKGRGCVLFQSRQTGNGPESRHFSKDVESNNIQMIHFLLPAETPQEVDHLEEKSGGPKTSHPKENPVQWMWGKGLQCALNVVVMKAKSRTWRRREEASGEERLRRWLAALMSSACCLVILRRFAKCTKIKMCWCFFFFFTFSDALQKA